MDSAGCVYVFMHICVKIMIREKGALYWRRSKAGVGWGRGMEREDTVGLEGGKKGGK